MSHFNPHDTRLKDLVAQAPETPEKAAMLRELVEEQQRFEILLAELQKACRKMHEINTHSAPSKAAS